jgi:hypothetical protein
VRESKRRAYSEGESGRETHASTWSPRRRSHPVAVDPRDIRAPASLWKLEKITRQGRDNEDGKCK